MADLEVMEEAGSAETDLAQIRDLARAVNAICRNATLDLVFRVGELIITRLFNNDARSWERAEATPSYRALANCGELILSPSALCRAVSTYALVVRLGGRQRWEYLAASHFQEVLSLPPALQEELLTSAEEGHWTVARLRSAAAPSRPRRKSGTIRIARSVVKLGCRLAEHKEELDRAGLEDLERETVDQLKDAIAVAFHELSELSSWVEEHAHDAKAPASDAEGCASGTPPPAAAVQRTGRGR